ncbi:MAG: aspartate aminotransferase family protein [Gemmatimonadaceae bacterium]
MTTAIRTEGHLAPAGSDALLPVYRRTPVTFVGGEGARLIDADGKRYIDFTSGIAVNALGYADSGLETAMHEAASGLVHVSNLYHSEPAARLACALVDRTFADSVFFCNSGAEANEGAFKFARRWGRTIGGGAKNGIVALRGSFHGRLFASLAATDRPEYRAPFRPLAGGMAIVERDPDELAAVLDAETIAALIVEPVQGEGGVRVLDAALLRWLRAITVQRRIALIFDEIQCGLGRTGHFLACEAADVTPDIVTLAKPLAGGLPMGAVLLSSEIARSVQPGDHATTFGGGPFVASVALHVVERLSDPELLAAVRRNGEWLGHELRAISQRTDRARSVRGTGFMWGLDVVDPAADVVGRALDLGLLLCSAGPHTVRLLPPLIAGLDDLAAGLALLEEALCSYPR